MAPELIGQPDAGAATVSATSYDLVLFVSAGSASTARAIRQVQALCEGRLAGRHRLRVVDVHDVELVPARVLATPTLLRQNPAPERMAVGDFSDESRVLAALGIAVDFQTIGRVGPSGAAETSDD